MELHLSQKNIATKPAYCDNVSPQNLHVAISFCYKSLVVATSVLPQNYVVARGSCHEISFVALGYCHKEYFVAICVCRNGRARGNIIQMPREKSLRYHSMLPRYQKMLHHPIATEFIATLGNKYYFVAIDTYCNSLLLIATEKFIAIDRFPCRTMV